MELNKMNNWFIILKTASFINQVQISHVGNHVSLWINGNKYHYSKIPKELIITLKQQINLIKKNKNLKEAGSELSYLIKNLEKYKD